MTPEQKQGLGMLRSTFRKIAASIDTHNTYWDYALEIDSMLETGKCTLAGSAEELIDKCADELVKFAEKQS